MPEQPYNTGIQLRDLEGRPAVGLDIRGSSTAVTLTVTLQGERGYGQTLVDIFHPDEALEYAGAIRAAAERMQHLRAGTGVAV